MNAIRPTTKRLLALVAFVTGCGCHCGIQAESESPASADEKITYARDIQPLLAKHCLLCHGPDEAEGGLRLDSAERAFATLESDTRAIVPGNVAASELLRRLTSDDESERMPPESDRLPAEEIELFRKWISEGAKYEKHWSYRGVTRPALPKVANEESVRSPLDRFVIAQLDRAGIAPSEMAGRATLIKRLYFDLIGLPPTPQEVDAFENDLRPDATEQLVDRLLASEHFGERWGRHWLDKARYADSDGYEKDRPRPNAWRYRDWVIEAINRDMPFDQFSIEQLAGDLLPDASPTQKLATAFHRQTLTNTEGGTDKEEFRVEATFDRTETTAAVWMALTLTCARCHSHKYDAIAQREYYELFAFFNNANETNTDITSNEEALARFVKEEKAFKTKVAALTKRLDSAKKKLRPKIATWEKEMLAKIEAAGTSLEFQPARPIAAKAKSGAKLTTQEDGSVLATGENPDKDKYELTIRPPAAPLTGIRIEVLTFNSMGKKGPGRTAHGNFVLSELRAYLSDDPKFKKYTQIAFASAESDFAQNKFPAGGAVSTKAGTGWAISPQMVKDHEITFFTKQPLSETENKFLRVVLDQQYGGQHTIGRFRISTMTGFDPLKSLPKPVAIALKIKSAKRDKKQQQQIVDYVVSLDPDANKLAKELAALNKKTPKSPKISVRVLASANRQTKILHRGDFLQPSDDVSAGVLGVVGSIHPLKPRTEAGLGDRLDLARWLMAPSHPLTSRVAVNHIWAHLFGQGLVPTSNDFGIRGETPTHPQLLDWLAWQYPREMGWSRKTLIKTIVMSATYQQSSRHRLELQKTDPTNRLLARQNRLRGEAEVVRDLYLAAGGLLSKKIGGPSVFPPLPPGVMELSYNNNFKWSTSTGEDRYRRGMYTFFKRTSPHPNLISFDCPDSNTTTLERNTSNTPLQALVTLNNDVFNEAAQAMARRVLSEAGTADRERLVYALRLCIARNPDEHQLQSFGELLTSARKYYQANPEDAAKAIHRHVVKDVKAAENAAWVATVRMIMNLDEFIVRE